MQQQPYTVHESSLINAIHASPHDDGPRLDYADWLEANEAGDYAQFIRLQCQKPYIGICNRNPTSPWKSLSWDFPWQDKAAEDRLQRLLALLPKIYRTPRFEPLARLSYYEEFYRGLSLLEVEEGQHGPPCFIPSSGEFTPPPLARLRLLLNVDRLHLAQWLNHPLMYRVDELRIFLNFQPGSEEDDEGEYEFDVPAIRMLADWPLLERLTTLNLCAPISVQARPLIAELLEPRVFVSTSY